MGSIRSEKRLLLSLDVLIGVCHPKNFNESTQYNMIEFSAFYMIAVFFFVYPPSVFVSSGKRSNCMEKPELSIC